MKALLSVVAVLGLAAVFGWFEPASASTQPATSDEVRLVSEQTSNDDGPLVRNRNARKSTTRSG